MDEEIVGKKIAQKKLSYKIDEKKIKNSNLKKKTENSQELLKIFFLKKTGEHIF